MQQGFLDAAAAICGAAHVVPGAQIEPRFLEAARYGSGHAAADRKSVV